MNSKVIKSCAVPLCDNTSRNAPNKIFVYVPNNKAIRHKWLSLARRDPTAIGIKTPIYFCEDHFDLPVDMENYMEYHVMGTVSQVRMNSRCIPSKFECQPNRRKTILSNTVEQLHIPKKQRITLIEECEKDSVENSTTHLEIGEPSANPELPLHSDLQCKVCHNDIIGFRYTCVQCPHWDMCASCEARGEHPAHYVLRLPAPKPPAETAAVLAAIRKQIDALLRLHNEMHEIYIKEEPVEVKEEIDVMEHNLTQEMYDRSVPEVNIHKGSCTVYIQPIENAIRCTEASRDTEATRHTEEYRDAEANRDTEVTRHTESTRATKATRHTETTRHSEATRKTSAPGDQDPEQDEVEEAVRTLRSIKTELNDENETLS